MFWEKNIYPNYAFDLNWYQIAQNQYFYQNMGNNQSIFEFDLTCKDPPLRCWIPSDGLKQKRPAAVREMALSYLSCWQGEVYITQGKFGWDWDLFS